jgi:hypothetical protein
MDEVILDFLIWVYKYFNNFDIQSLINYKQVKRCWKNFIVAEKPLNDKFVIMWLVYGYWKALPKCLDWVENNFDFIMYKFKRIGICYNMTYMRIIIPRDLKNLQLETEFCERDYQSPGFFSKLRVVKTLGCSGNMPQPPAPTPPSVFTTPTLHASVCTKCVCATCFRLLIACKRVDAHCKCVNAYTRLKIIFWRLRSGKSLSEALLFAEQGENM